MRTTYLVFIRNEATKQEFTAPYEGVLDTHDAIMLKAQQDYPRPRFTVHTAYATQELSDALENLYRWGQLPSRPQFRNQPNETKQDVGPAMLSQLFEGQRKKAAGLVEEINIAPAAAPKPAPVQPAPAPQVTPQPMATTTAQPTEKPSVAPQEAAAKTVEESPLQRLRRELESSRPTGGAVNASALKQPAASQAPVAKPVPQAAPAQSQETKAPAPAKAEPAHTDDIPPLSEESVIFRLKAWYGQTV